MALLSRKPTKNLHPLQPARRLLAEHKQLIRELRTIVGLPRAHWNALYQQAIASLADYIQQLPASEAHHHTHPGGLLEHTLETALFALRIRQGRLLPPNADAETVARHKDVWTYAVFTAAIAHDLAKPITDQHIELYDKKHRHLSTWSPLRGPMLTQQPAARHYAVRYRPDRRYADHARSSLLYLNNIVPTVGIEWIHSDPELYTSWISLLTAHDEDAGMIGSIIHEADRLSVARNLAGDQTNMARPASHSQRKPLHQRILTSLRHNIDEGALPLNRDGAAGWIVGDSLWLVVKRALDQVRDQMTQEGQTGIPARNDRIMDELQQYGILIPNGDKAVWKCTVFAPGWPKAHELTMLQIPVEKVWPNPDTRPEAFTGSVAPISVDSAETAETTPANTNCQKPDSDSVGLSEQKEPEPGPRVSAEADPEPALKPPTIDFASIAGSALPPSSQDTDGDGAPGEPSAEQRSNTQNTQSDQEQPQSQPEQPHAGRAFLEWLRRGLAERSLEVNNVNARLHMTKEGLLLVSPAVFKQYDKKRWSYVQKRFTKLKLHERSANGTNIHDYVVSGKKKRSLVKGFLITDTDTVFPGIELPPINHALSRVEK